jgi:hypothetical protein
MPINNRILHSVKINDGWVIVKFTNQQGEETKYACGENAFVLMIEEHINQCLQEDSKPVHPNQKKQ